MPEKKDPGQGRRKIFPGKGGQKAETEKDKQDATKAVEDDGKYKGQHRKGGSDSK